MAQNMAQQTPVKNSRIESCTLARQQNKLNLASMAESIESLRRKPQALNVLNCCVQLSQKYKCSVSQIAIQWILQQGHCTSVCVGVEDVQELDQNMTCLLGELVLTPEDMDLLDRVSSIELHYPYQIQLSEVVGLRKIRPIQTTEFEQMNLLTEALELEGSYRDERRFNLSETAHESVKMPFTEREFMRHPQLKSYQAMSLTQSLVSNQMQPQIQQSNLINQSKLI
jgi:hypothetical protein